MSTLRCFCVPAPGPMGDLAHHYLVALRNVVASSKRAAALRAISLVGGIPGAGSAWADLSHLFATPMDYPFVNVVISLPGWLMGGELRAGPRGIVTGVDYSDGATGALSPVDAADAANQQRGVSGPPVYVPKTAFHGLYTVGCPNVAITTVGQPAVPAAALTVDEVTAILAYDVVVCPSSEDVVALQRAADVLDRRAHVIHLPPSGHEALAAFVEELLAGI